MQYAMLEKKFIVDKLRVNTLTADSAKYSNEIYPSMLNATLTLRQFII